MAQLPAIADINMSNAHVYYGALAQTNYYQLYITTDWGVSGTTDPTENGIKKFLKNEDVRRSYGLTEGFITRNIGLLCSEAVLPASSYATSEVKDNFMGVTQEFAHTRMFTDMDLTFYVDGGYQVLGFFEAWMNYISGGNEKGEPLLSSFDKGYYRRFNYPDFYKHNGIYIRKFERNWKKETKSIVYRLKNAFPKSMSSIPIAYGGSEMMKVTISFNYDYYYVYREGYVNDETPKIDSTEQKGSGVDSMDQPNILGNTPRELEELRRNAYIKSTKGKVFGRSQAARDLDAQLGVDRSSL